ncbi:MAG: hypothetical protein J6Y98_02770 [Bacteroidales bacterium]|nr:hypothetical protein [Bacteroidales bacterium]
MKKIVLALAVIATVACFSSCSKKCTCKMPTGEVTYDLDEMNEQFKQYGVQIDKCTDLNISGIVECS